LELFQLLFVLYPFAFWHLNIPRLFNRVNNSATGLVNKEFEFWVVGQPKESFSSSDAKPEWPVFLTGYQGMELNWVEGSTSSVDKARNVIFDRFRNINWIVSLRDPSLANFSLLQIESLLEDHL